MFSPLCSPRLHEVRRPVRARQPAEPVFGSGLRRISLRPLPRRPLDRDAVRRPAALDLALARDDARRRSRQRRLARRRRHAAPARGPARRARGLPGSLDQGRRRTTRRARSRRAGSRRRSPEAKELGITAIALPTAGNAGGAAAAYAAKAGLECHVFMPADTPPVFRIECERYGAKVTLVDGLIDACGKIVAARATAEGWHDVSTLKEPYRVEGKKTMGYELAEDFGWELPDAILYPDRRRHGPDRHVEGVRGDGGAGLDRQQAPEDDLRPGRRLRPDPEGLRRRQARLGEMGERAHLRLGPARPEGVRRLPDPPRHPRLARRRHRRLRRRDAPRLRRDRRRRRASSSRPKAAPSGPPPRRSPPRGSSTPRAASCCSTRGPGSSTSDPDRIESVSKSPVP